MLRKMMLALALCGLTTSALAQAGKPAEAQKTRETHGKTMPQRDAKGRFVKKDKTEKTLPMRDPKTGRFVKKGTVSDKHDTKDDKTLPMRDPKTGRFMKKEKSGDKHDAKKKS